MKNSIKNQKKTAFQKISLFIFLLPSFGFIFFSPNPNSEWLDQYKEAKKNKDCFAFQRLYKNPKFTLKDVSKIYFYKICTKHEVSDFRWNQFPKWLHRFALQAWLHRASKRNDHADFIQASFAFSQFTPHYEEKTRYLTRSIQVAKKINSPLLPKLRQKLYQIAPSWIPTPTFKDYLKVAKDYKKRNQFEKSIQYYRKVLNSKKSSVQMKSICYQQLKWLYKNTKKRNRYLKATKQYNIFQKKYMHHTFKKNYIKNQIQLARNYWNDHQSDLALKIFKKIRKQKAASPFLPEINWLIGKIYEEQNNYHVAMMYFQKSQSLASKKDKDSYEKIIWSNVWNARKLGTYKKSIQFLKNFEKQSTQTNPQFTYWKAKILEQKGEHKLAKTEYQKLVDQAPFSFHGMIAHHHLKIPLKLNLISITPKKELPYTLIDDLITTEEKQLVTTFVKYLLNNQKAFSSNKEHFLQIFLKSTNMGFYLPFFRFVGSLASKEKSQFIKQYAYTLFPTIYQKEVHQASTLFNIPKDLIYSIIRQESAFDPRALSPANAVGLMQILPSVAKQTAKKNGIAFRRVHDLYHPQTNILIGTAHLQSLFKKYGQSVIINTATYNAGHRPVYRWLKKFQTTDPIEFIQNIPYKETQTYIRLIIRNFILYSLLQDADHTMHFPEWLLHLPQQNS